VGRFQLDKSDGGPNLEQKVDIMTQNTPQEWCTRDAFAAADMVEWLSYPTELGREPDELEKMAVFEARSPDGPVALYVWRFKGTDGKWLAATSGPYLLVGEPAPCSGGSTFSSFEEWDSATAEEHAHSVLETLDEVIEGQEEDEED